MKFLESFNYPFLFYCMTTHMFKQSSPSAWLFLSCKEITFLEQEDLGKIISTLLLYHRLLFILSSHISFPFVVVVSFFLDLKIFYFIYF